MASKNLTHTLVADKKKIPKELQTNRYRTQARRAYAIIIPFLAYMALWTIFPLGFGLFLGFTDFTGLNEVNFRGLRNFERFFSSPTYPTLLVRQTWLGFLNVGLTMFFSFVLALALNKPFKGRGIFRAVVYMPHIAAVTATTAVFVALLDPYQGAMNQAIEALGGSPIIWSYSAFWMFVWIIFFNVWRGIGPAAILWLGGLQGIDPMLYEAARVDGASKWQEIRYITLPGLRFITMFVMLTGIIGAMQMFDSVMFISKGGPALQTDVIMYRIYRDGFLNANFGMAGASSWVLGFAILIFAFVYYQIARRKID